MAKYSKKIVDKICKLISSDSYTITEICAQVGINQDTYFTWKKEKPEFSEAIEKAQDARRAYFALEAKNSLLKKVKGYSVDETKTVYVDSKEKGTDGKAKAKIKEKTITTKYFQPDTAAIIFTLINCDGDNWKNKQDNTVKVADSVTVTLDI